MSLFYVGGNITVTNQPERQVKDMLSLARKFSVEEAGQGMVDNLLPKDGEWFLIGKYKNERRCKYD